MILVGTVPNFGALSTGFAVERARSYNVAAAAALRSRGAACVVLAPDDYEEASCAVDTLRRSLRRIPVVVAGKKERIWRDHRGAREGIFVPDVLAPSCDASTYVADATHRLRARHRQIGDYCEELRLSRCFGEILWRAALGVPQSLLPTVLDVQPETVRGYLKELRRRTGIPVLDDMVAAARNSWM